MEQLKYLRQCCLFSDILEDVAIRLWAPGPPINQPDPMQVRLIWLGSSEALVFDVELEGFAKLLLDFLACQWKYAGIIQYCVSERWVSHESKRFLRIFNICNVSSDASCTITGIYLTNKSAGRPASKCLCMSFGFTPTSLHLKLAFWIGWSWNWHLLIPNGYKHSAPMASLIVDVLEKR